MSFTYWRCSWNWSQTKPNSWRRSVQDQPLNTDDEQDDDDDEIEYDENGYPTPAQVQRWKELHEAAARKWLEKTEKVIAEAAREIAEIEAQGGHVKLLITVDELRAAGALDCPPAWRKSLRNPRDLFSDVSEDASPRPNEPSQEKTDTDDNASSDDRAAT
jgi:hypothetical protein